MNILPPKYDRQLNTASGGLGLFFCIVLAAIVLYWLCQDTSAGLTASLHHVIHYAPQKASTGFWPLDVLVDWL